LTTNRAEPAGSASTPATDVSGAGPSVPSVSARKSARKTDVLSGDCSGGTPGPSFVLT
jgi:hypothetical protein